MTVWPYTVLGNEIHWHKAEMWDWERDQLTARLPGTRVTCKTAQAVSTSLLHKFYASSLKPSYRFFEKRGEWSYGVWGRIAFLTPGTHRPGDFFSFFFLGKFQVWWISVLFLCGHWCAEESSLSNNYIIIIKLDLGLLYMDEELLILLN